ncbi:MAG: hypothetical protein O3C20_14040, partial [Verrucomicrobia bacterium]|nr:hypothetical protein [Verrucomicrobiota bacterium]
MKLNPRTTRRIIIGALWCPIGIACFVFLDPVFAALGALIVGGFFTFLIFGDGSGLTNIPASAIVPVVPPAPPAGMVLIPA